MKFTPRQLLERENLHWFGEGFKKQTSEPTDEAFREYLNFSERGTPIKDKLNFYQNAKMWRGRHVHELWEPSFYAQDGSWPGYVNLLKEEDGAPIPRNVAEFIAKEIFAGQDRQKIMDVYEQILK